jgi:hypothetical protein
MGGIAAAQSPFILMGDGDDSYDFNEIPKFLAQLRKGFDIVQGCRLPSGGGTIGVGAMPWLHRYIGNPLFSFLAQRWFNAPIHDIYCGMRAFTRDLYTSLQLTSEGMEFATEMIIKASRNNARFAEVPITLHPDGRTSHPPHLKTFRDGWRTLRFFLILCPKWLFVFPGKLLMILGLVGYVVFFAGIHLGDVRFGLNTLLFASLAILGGQQAIFLGLGSNIMAIKSGLLAPEKGATATPSRSALENWLIVGVIAVLCGLLLLSMVILHWRAVQFGGLDYTQSMRMTIPGATLVAFGLQLILSGFFLEIIDLHARHE